MTDGKTYIIYMYAGELFFVLIIELCAKYKQILITFGSNEHLSCLRLCICICLCWLWAHMNAHNTDIKPAAIRCIHKCDALPIIVPQLMVYCHFLSNFSHPHSFQLRLWHEWNVYKYLFHSSPSPLNAFVWLDCNCKRCKGNEEIRPV